MFTLPLFDCITNVCCISLFNSDCFGLKKNYSESGAIHVRQLQAKDFCNRGFVFGRAGEDGLGNDMYKILTAAGLGIMLNRSLIIGEHGYVFCKFINMRAFHGLK